MHAPGVFEWQHGCYNNVGQEWAWNWHFLPPDVLTAHEDEWVDALLRTYRQYVPCDDELERLADRMRPTPDAERIIPRFLDFVCRHERIDVNT